MEINISWSKYSETCKGIFTHIYLFSIFDPSIFSSSLSPSLFIAMWYPVSHFLLPLLTVQSFFPPQFLFCHSPLLFICQFVCLFIYFVMPITVLFVGDIIRLLAPVFSISFMIIGATSSHTSPSPQQCLIGLHVTIGTLQSPNNVNLQSNLMYQINNN